MAEPYYADDLVTLYHGDCREITEWLAADVLVTDPPYGETSLAWDRWVDGWPALAATGSARSMWCFGSMRMFLDHRDEFGDWKLSQDIVWEKHNGTNFARDRFARVHEHALHWYRGPWSGIYHEPPTTPDATARVVRKKARPAQWTGAVGSSTYTSVDGGPRLMRSVIYARSMHGRALHPTQKPTEILEPLIHYAARPGAVVADPFAGSGSTLVAAKMLGDKAIGIEADERNCEIAAQRLLQDALPFEAVRG